MSCPHIHFLPLKEELRFQYVTLLITRLLVSLFWRLDLSIKRRHYLLLKTRMIQSGMCLAVFVCCLNGQNTRQENNNNKNQYSTSLPDFFLKSSWKCRYINRLGGWQTGGEASTKTHDNQFEILFMNLYHIKLCVIFV